MSEFIRWIVLDAVPTIYGAGVFLVLLVVCAPVTVVLVSIFCGGER